MKFSDAVQVAHKENVSITRKLWQTDEWLRERDYGRPSLSFVRVFDARIFGAPSHVSMECGDLTNNILVYVRFHAARVMGSEFLAEVGDILADDWEVVDPSVISGFEFAAS